jgi:hypothetical protein
LRWSDELWNEEEGTKVGAPDGLLDWMLPGL